MPQGLQSHNSKLEMGVWLLYSYEGLHNIHLQHQPHKKYHISLTLLYMITNEQVSFSEHMSVRTNSSLRKTVHNIKF